MFSSCLRYYYRNPYVKIIVEEWSAGSKKPAETWDLFNETDDMESRYLATCAATLDFVIVVSSKSDPSKDDSHVQVCYATILLPHLSHFISGHCHRSLRCVLSFFGRVILYLWNCHWALQAQLRYHPYLENRETLPVQEVTIVLRY